MAQIGFIGMGNMGYAMLKGALKNFQTEDIVFTDVNESRVSFVEEQTKVLGVENASVLLECCKYIVLAIKPQFYDEVLEEIKVRDDQIIISIAPGKSIDYLKDVLGKNVKIVRAMPNTPALVNEGMSGISFSKDIYTEEEKQVICTMFQSFGQYEIIDEKLMDSVVCVSGSSPAYVYMFIEALADSGVKYGLPRDKAYKFAAQTVLGAAKMVLETNKHPGELKDQVCSPGGTTIVGVEALEEYGFRNAVMKASDKCYEAAQGLKK